MDERILVLSPCPTDAVEKLLSQLSERQPELCEQIRRDLSEVKLASLRSSTRDALADVCAGRVGSADETARRLSTALFGGVVRSR